MMKLTSSQTARSRAEVKFTSKTRVWWRVPQIFGDPACHNNIIDRGSQGGGGGGLIFYGLWTLIEFCLFVCLYVLFIHHVK